MPIIGTVPGTLNMGLHVFIVDYTIEINFNCVTCETTCIVMVNWGS